MARDTSSLLYCMVLSRDMAKMVFFLTSLKRMPDRPTSFLQPFSGARCCRWYRASCQRGDPSCYS